MSRKKSKFYEETWFCVVIYFIFFPLGLYLASRSKKVSKDVKNLMKFGVVLLLLMYAYFIGSYFRIESNFNKSKASEENSAALETVNKEEFIKQGDITVKDIEKLLKKYKAEAVSGGESKGAEEAQSSGGEEKRQVSSAGYKVKIKGDPYEYNISYNTSAEGEKGKINLLITVKYPVECVLDFSNSQFIKDVISVMEGENYDFDSFNSWTQKSEENYSRKEVISSSVYSRNIADLEENLNFNTGEDGVMQINLIKKVMVE